MELKSVVSQLEKEWKQVYPAQIFNYNFYDESLAMLYQKDRQASILINASMAITIFISCIGLFGLMLFTTQKRAKEICIRKILGASMANILAMLGKDLVILVLIAFFIASPVAWYFMNEWLQGFAYRINIDLPLFALAGFGTITIALITISSLAIKAAIVNPVKDLRID